MGELFCRSNGSLAERPVMSLRTQRRIGYADPWLSGGPSVQHSAAIRSEYSILRNAWPINSGFGFGKVFVELDNRSTTRRHYVYTRLPTTETDLTKSVHIEHSIERHEVQTWAACAGSGSTPQNHRDQCEGLHRCRLPFIVAVKERSGTSRLIRVTSQALGEESAVFFSREPLPLFDLIEVQLDDGSDRPFIQAKVVDYDRTIGGYQSHVEFLVGEGRPGQDAGPCNPGGSGTFSPWWSGNAPPPGNA